MIPKIIHYCWVSGAPLPPLAEQCIASWNKYMPSWQIMRWDESNFDIASAPLYVRQAYEVRKFAFVSDYVRLWALEQYGGLYMDVDFMVFRPFDELMDKYPAFAGYEGSKRQPVMQGVIASEPHGAWVRDMLGTYKERMFIKEDGSLDMTPNTGYFTDRLEAQGFVADGVEKDFFIIDNQKNLKKNKELSDIYNTFNSLDHQYACEPVHRQPNDQPCSIDSVAQTPSDNSLQKMSKNPENGSEDRIFMLHVFPVYYFCPVLTTGEDVRTPETYCEHKGESSWAVNTGWKVKLLKFFSPKWRTKLIKLKRRILG